MNDIVEHGCSECNESLENHTVEQMEYCFKEINEKLSLVFDIFDMKKTEPEVDSLPTDTSDSHVLGIEQHE